MKGVYDVEEEYFIRLSKAVEFGSASSRIIDVQPCPETHVESCCSQFPE